MASPVVIKKYTNRRLYHTEDKCYITLEQLAQIIRQGHEVRVVDNQTQEDITQETLLQIVLADDGSHNLFSLPLLHQMIRMDQEHFQEFNRYLESGVGYFVKLKQSMVTQLNLWNQVWTNSLIPPFLQPSPPTAAATSNDSADAKATAELQAQLQQYRQQLDDYHRQVERLERELQQVKERNRHED